MRLRVTFPGGEGHITDITFVDWALMKRELGPFFKLTKEDIQCAFYDLLAGFCVRYEVMGTEFEIKRIDVVPSTTS